MKDLIEIKGYKCPYCGNSNTDKNRMIKHIKICPQNDEYTQKCITCFYLESDWLQRVVYQNKSPCHGGRAECPYINCDDTEIIKEVFNHCNIMKSYGYDVDIAEQLKEQDNEVNRCR